MNDRLQHELLEQKDMLKTESLDHILVSTKPMSC